MIKQKRLPSKDYALVGQFSPFTTKRDRNGLESTIEATPSLKELGDMETIINIYNCQRKGTKASLRKTKKNHHGIRTSGRRTRIIYPLGRNT